MNTHTPVSEGVLAVTRNWHGSIDKKMSNINNAMDLIRSHQPPPGPVPDGAKAVTTIWPINGDLYRKLVANRDSLNTQVAHCRTTSASTIDRTNRNVLLKETIELFTVTVKAWAHGLFADGTMTATDVHQLGFLVPGEQGGSHGRVDPTDVLAEVKVHVINEDYVRIVIDQSSDENAGPVLHGWPAGVKNALVVITHDDGQTEALRFNTSRLHNDIKMPEGSHGKSFVIHAAFLRHVDDEPRFGNAPTFTMPRSTFDLMAGHNKDKE